MSGATQERSSTACLVNDLKCVSFTTRQPDRRAAAHRGRATPASNRPDDL